MTDSTTTSRTWMKANTQERQEISRAIARLRAGGARVSTIHGHDPASGHWDYGLTLPETITSSRIGRHPFTMTADDAPPGRVWWHTDGRLMVASRYPTYVIAALEHLAHMVDNLGPARHRPPVIPIALVHAATDDGEGHCTMCGLPVTPISTGQGTGYAHPGGYVAGRTPAAVIAARALIADWQQRASELSPDRPETYDNDGPEEMNDAVADTMVDCANELDAALRSVAP